MTISASAVDIGGAGGARALPNSVGAPTEFWGLEKETERETDNLLLRAPLDLKTYLRLCNTTMISRF